MKVKKIRVGILFGGKSAEHEVSLKSARSIADSIDKNKYELFFILIDKTGKWFESNIRFEKNKSLSLVLENNRYMTIINSDGKIFKIDVVFPILHGPYGEDGTIQGLLKTIGVPFVGAKVLGSAIGMDKDIMKRLLKEAGIPIPNFITVRKGESVKYKDVLKKLGQPFFVKPANMGSSIGISKVKNNSEFNRALEKAFEFDQKILIEENIKGREIECAVLGNDRPIASVPGEIIVKDEFYHHDVKYIDSGTVSLKIPAALSKKQIKDLQNLSILTYKTLLCEGFGRVDFFLKDSGDFVVNEINTIPGFTQYSMYTKLWEESGISFTQLIDMLIDLALC